MITDTIAKGYLRLYRVIKGLPPLLGVCRVCRGELDSKYKARKQGKLCLNCYRHRHLRRN